MNKPVITSQQLADATQLIYDHLQLERELGEKSIECDSVLLRSLAQPPDITAAKAVPASTPPPPTPPAEPEEIDMKKRSPAPLANSTIEFTSLDEVHRRIASCQLCQLHQWRTKTVPGAGNTNGPDIMFIGEGPGKDEDARGIPFVGRAGVVLERLITRMGYTRDEIFIGNIVKCRPTQENEGKRDRPPTYEEMQGCLPYLKAQIKFIRPKTIVLLGNTALLGLFGEKGITKIRGQWRSYEGIPVMPTYHPSYLLRNGERSTQPYWDVWDDMKQILKHVGKPIPGDN